MTMSSFRSVTVLIGLLWGGLYTSASAFTFSFHSPLSSVAFTNENAIRYSGHLGQNGVLQMSVSNEVSQRSRPTGVIKGALQKMRGISVSVEFSPKDVSKTSPLDMELLSQELRKAKVSSIWTCDCEVLGYFSKEQNSAKGNFPGPVPIVYQHRCREGGEELGERDVENLVLAIQNGASAVVLDSNLLKLYNDKHIQSMDNGDVDVICKVENLQQVQMALDEGYDSAFLISGSLLDEEMQLILRSIPKSSVVIASLSSMQPGSQEISRAKALAGLVVPDSAKVSSVLIHDACVGDQEDVKYCSFVVENINKKSSSTFQMTGLTGAANGHFGSEVSGGFRAAKWQRRNQQDASS
jgi:hypothetical protein